MFSVTAFLLGNASPVLGLYRGADDHQVVCVTKDKVAKFFRIPDGVEEEPFAGVAEEVVSLKTKKARPSADGDDE